MAEAYERGAILGEGTFGVVYAAIRKKDGLEVAIKRSKPMGGEGRNGVHFTILREVNYMQEFQCPYILSLLEVFTTGDAINMVLERCSFDLKDIIYDKSLFIRVNDLKCFMKMILEGIHACHLKHILHRDLKPANVLIGGDGLLKLADFGFARSHSSPREMTNEVVTLAYRSPELLYGTKYYGGGADMWAIGCIFAELIVRYPLFPGTSTVDQLGKIFKVLGTPSEKDWPNHSLLPNYLEFESTSALDLHKLFSSTDPGAHGIDLLGSMLCHNPNKRITAEEALNHAYFTSAPEASKLGETPKPMKKID